MPRPVRPPCRTCTWKSTRVWIREDHVEDQVQYEDQVQARTREYPELAHIRNRPPPLLHFGDSPKSALVGHSHAPHVEIKWARDLGEGPGYRKPKLFILNPGCPPANPCSTESNEGFSTLHIVGPGQHSQLTERGTLRNSLGVPLVLFDRTIKDSGLQIHR